METRTYTEKSNARRAARAAGVDPSLIIETADGFTFTPPSDDPVDTPALKVDDDLCRLEPAFEGQRSTPKDDEDIPAFLKVGPQDRKEAWAKNPPKAAPIKETNMAKTGKAKSAKSLKAASASYQSGANKTATLLAMLKGKGSTVDELTKATGWLPHTLRARISGLAKPKSKGGEGLKIERERVEGVTSYRLA